MAESTRDESGSPSKVSSSGFNLSPLSRDEINSRAAGLTPEERRVLLFQGTERPFCGGLLGNKEEGTYVCRLCDLPLFRSSAKFESGTGWPSFYQPFDPEHLRYISDESHGMIRTEIRCSAVAVIWDMSLRMARPRRDVVIA